MVHPASAELQKVAGKGTLGRSDCHTCLGKGFADEQANANLAKADIARDGSAFEDRRDTPGGLRTLLVVRPATFDTAALNISGIC